MQWPTKKEVLKQYRILTRQEAFWRLTFLSLVIALILTLVSYFLPWPYPFLCAIAALALLAYIALDPSSAQSQPLANQTGAVGVNASQPEGQETSRQGDTSDGAVKPAPDPAPPAGDVTGPQPLRSPLYDASVKPLSRHIESPESSRPSLMKAVVSSSWTLDTLRVAGSVAIAYLAAKVIFSISWFYALPILFVIYGEVSYTMVSAFMAHMTSKDVDPDSWVGRIMFRIYRHFSCPQGFYLLGEINGKIIGLQRMLRFMHVLVAGPTGEGKSTGLIVPQLLFDADSKGSAVVPDVKSPELYNLTAGRWITRGKRAFLFDAWNNDTVGINFLPGADDEDRIVIVDTLMKEKEDVVDKEEGFFRSRTMYILYACLKLVEAFKDEYCNMATVYKAVESVEMLQHFVDASSDEVKSLFSDWQRLSGESRVNAIQSIRRALDVFMSQEVRRAFSRSEFRLDMLFNRDTPCLLVIGAPTDKSYQGTKVASLIINLIINMAFKKGRQHADAVRQGTTTEVPNDLFLYLDELRSLKIPTLPDLVSIARHIRVGIVASLQDIGMLKFYKQNASSLMTNFRTQAYMRGMDLDSCKYISQSIGDTDKNAYRQMKGAMAGEVSKPTLAPDRVRDLPEGQAIVFSPKIRPFVLDLLAAHKTPWIKRMKEPAPKALRELYKTWGVADKPLEDPEIPMVIGSAQVGTFPDVAAMKSGKPIVVNNAHRLDNGLGTSVFFEKGGGHPAQMEELIMRDAVGMQNYASGGSGDFDAL